MDDVTLFYVYKAEKTLSQELHPQLKICFSKVFFQIIYDANIYCRPIIKVTVYLVPEEYRSFSERLTCRNCIRRLVSQHAVLFQGQMVICERLASPLRRNPFYLLYLNEFGQLIHRNLAIHGSLFLKFLIPVLI